MDFGRISIEEHKKHRGKIKIEPKVSINSKEDLSVYYTPGVAAPCQVIAKNPAKAYELTPKGNMVAIVTDGSAVLGLGNIGGLAGYPVMEGKALLFKKFAGIDAIPICLATQDPEEIIRTVKNIAPQFGGINLEDISAPRCFEIERRLSEELPIPVFHDDQHGTAIAVLAGLINALKVVSKDVSTVKIAISGAGAAGTAVLKLLLSYGAKHIAIADSAGSIYKGRKQGMNHAKEEIAELIGGGSAGTLADIMKGADVFIGISVPGIVTGGMVKSMAQDAIVFAMANPTPEITPEEAAVAGAKIVATGRSDLPNQVNNALVFPGIFRGALDNRVPAITTEMKISAAKALAGLVKNPTAEKIIPSIFDEGVATAVSKAIA
ncbi:MAG: malic protein NAD-binding protein, malate dehydrogenase (oxaloacetate-decarboxylating) [Candidatus Peregrinibacteria bacterium GW2011_GWF2_43_17]|nr:MAG: malic protein NAD-binding protein, malate dehydrogenase (oxaloacetate-decarboxylating) [Candidatus Peregrinibacteria bacterium GW2011_GWF2_43_17]KKT20550.1 MAG: Malic protein NAD-binding protein [Candidatus Peregrinibacteria bacterium GW2011_GWA2_43_8]HAU39931.1 NAD-dependent malic enzyme [Candidatus Peregrinibacteria bacterium]